MATAFDPYHRWLSIPPSEQPPNHYRLLGLEEFEANFEVIGNAAERQITHVRPHLQLPLRPYATNLIRELDVARKCLLDPEAKLAYDSWLEQHLNTPTAESSSRVQQRVVGRATRTAASPVSAAGVPHIAFTNFPVQAEQNFGPSSFDTNEQFPSNASPAVVPSIVAYRKSYRPRSKGSPLAFLILWFAGGVMGLLAGYCVLCLIDPKYDFLNVMFSKEDRGSSATDATATPPAIAPSLQRPKLPERESRLGNRVRNAVPNNRDARTDDDAFSSVLPPKIASAEPLPRRSAPQAPNPFRVVIPEALRLPSRDSDGKPAMLTELSMENGGKIADQEIALSLSQGSNFTEGQLSLVSENKSWVAQWTQSSPGQEKISEADRTEVGRFSRIANFLCFAWAAEASEPAETAIRNSLLTIRVAGTPHYAALRVPENLDAISIDLKRPKVFAVFTCEYMPELENIRVDIMDSSMLPSHRVEGAGLRGLKQSDVTTLYYPEAIGAFTRVRVIKRGTRPAIEFETRYELPSGLRDELTITRGNRKSQYLRDELAAARAYQATRRIAELESDLHALERIAILARQWKEDTKLPLRFYINVDGYEINLAKTD